MDSFTFDFPLEWSAVGYADAILEVVCRVNATWEPADPSVGIRDESITVDWITVPGASEGQNTRFNSELPSALEVDIEVAATEEIRRLREESEAMLDDEDRPARYRRGADFWGGV